MGDTYYVESGAGGGGVGSIGDPFTFEEACDNYAADDLIYVKADAVYEAEYDTGGAKDCIAYLPTSGGPTTPIVFEAYHTTPGDGGIATLNADPAGDQYTNCVKHKDATVDYIVWKNFRFTGASGYNYTCSEGDYLTFKWCRFDTGGSVGLYGNNYNVFANCSFDNNNSGGADVDIGNLFVNCLFHNNSGRAITNSSMALTLYNCLSYNNFYSFYAASDNFYINSSAYPWLMANCTLDLENAATDGFWNDSATPIQCAIVNNIFYDAGTGAYAVKMDGDGGERMIASHNCYYDNAEDPPNSNFLDVDAGNGIGNRGDVTGDPAFLDEANDNYALGPDSSCRRQGIDAFFVKQFWDSFAVPTNPPTVSKEGYMDIGCMQRRDDTGSSTSARRPSAVNIDAAIGVL